MADLPNDFWSGWIILLTVFSFIGLAWLVLSICFLPQEQDRSGEEPVWDEDLKEGTNPAPLWWFWLILGAMVFSVIYLMLYPGLGSFAGAFRWSQSGQLEERMREYENQFGPQREQILATSHEELGADTRLMAAADQLFRQHCSACHGLDARGQADLFPDLTDDVWQWGGSAAQLEQTIRMGRMAVMVPWLGPLGEDGVDNVARYVQVIGTPDAEGHPGQAQYNMFCIACHGAQGQGNPALGAPRLNDDVWLYGGDLETIRASIANGRSGRMPSFADALDDYQIRLLVAWLLRQPTAG